MSSKSSVFHALYLFWIAIMNADNNHMLGLFLSLLDHFYSAEAYNGFPVFVVRGLQIKILSFRNLF